jgi:hypothetical protein
MVPVMPLCIGAGRHCDETNKHSRDYQQALCHGDQSRSRGTHRRNAADWRRPEQRGAPFWTGGDHRLAPVEELRTSQGKYKSPPPDSGFHYRLQPGKHASKNSGGTGLVPSWRTSNEAAAELRDTRFPPA